MWGVTAFAHAKVVAPVALTFVRCVLAFAHIVVETQPALMNICRDIILVLQLLGKQVGSVLVGAVAQFVPCFEQQCELGIVATDH